MIATSLVGLVGGVVPEKAFVARVDALPARARHTAHALLHFALKHIRLMPPRGVCRFFSTGEPRGVCARFPLTIAGALEQQEVLEHFYIHRNNVRLRS